MEKLNLRLTNTAPPVQKDGTGSERNTIPRHHSHAGGSKIPVDVVHLRLQAGRSDSKSPGVPVVGATIIPRTYLYDSWLEQRECPYST